MKDETFLHNALKEHGNAVFRLSCSLLKSSEDAQDVTQEVFLRLCAIDTEFENNQHLRNWLLKVAGNFCRDLYRKRKRHPIVLVDPLDDQMSERYFERKSQSSSSLDLSLNTLDLWKYVSQLAFSQRQIIHLRYVEELTLSEIADVLGISKGNARVRLHRAHRKLASLIPHDYEEVHTHEK